MSSKDKEYNTRQENSLLLKKKRVVLRELIKNIGEEKINLNDIRTGEKSQEFLNALNKSNATLWEAVVLKQFSSAITEEGVQSTRAAEFLRDTAGEKPSTQIDLNQQPSAVEGMTTEELKELSRLLKENEQHK